MKRVVAFTLLLVIIFGSTSQAQIGPDPDSWTNATDGQWALWYIRNNPTYYFQTKAGSSFPSFATPLAYDMKGGGARAAGMGNAFLAVSDDISAVSWNPAGLYNLEKPLDQPVLGLSYRSFSPDDEFDNTSTHVNYESTRATRETFDFSADDVFGGLGMGSITAPFRVKGHPIVGSVAFTRLGDEFYNGGFYHEEYVDWTPLDPDDASSNLAAMDYRVKYHSSLATVNIGFGTRVHERFTVGAALNIYIGKSTTNSLLTLRADSIVNIYDDGAFTAYGTPLASDKQRLDRVGTTEQIDTTTYSGVYLNFGVKYAGEKLTAGLIVKPPHTLKQTTDFKTFIASTDNGVVGDSVITYVDDFLIEIDIPLTIGGGLSYQATEKLLLAVDAEYRPFDNQKVRVRDSIVLVPGDVDKEYFTESNPYWNNVLSFRLGGEYMLETGSRLFPLMPVRAGFGYVPIPATDADYTYNSATGEVLPDNKSTAATTTISLGTGMHWEQIYLDLAWVHSSLDRKETFPSGAEWDSSIKSNTLSMTFTGFF